MRCAKSHGGRKGHQTVRRRSETKVYNHTSSFVRLCSGRVLSANICQWALSTAEANGSVAIFGIDPFWPDDRFYWISRQAIKYCRYFTEIVTFDLLETPTGRVNKFNILHLRGSEPNFMANFKSTGFILWWPWVPVENLMVIHPIVEIFHIYLKRTDRPTSMPSLQPCC